ncbi:MAG: hypothetical protein ACE5DM_00345 [Candidatus Nanoarchaeia archaeon]
MGGWIYRVYIQNTAYAKGESRSAVACVGYTFRVDELSYKDGILSFKLENKPGGEPLEKMVLESGDSTVEIDVNGLFAGTSQEVDAKINVGEEIKIYPAGCKDHNSKTFKVQ